MDKSERLIEDRIISILHQRFEIPDNMLDPSNWDEPLTGGYFRFSDVNLVYLLFEIEAEFCIRIRPEWLSDYQFRSINSISNIVKKHL